MGHEDLELRFESGFSVDTLVNCVKKSYIHGFSLFSDCPIFTEHFFYNGNLNVTDSLMTWAIEMLSCWFYSFTSCCMIVKVTNVTQMLAKSLREAFRSLPNIYLITPVAGNAINDIFSLTIHCSINVYTCTRNMTLD